MPASTRKMTAKSEESSSSDNRDPEKNDEGNEDRKEDNMGLSNNNSCTSSNVTAKSSSDGSIRQHISEQGATKQQQLEQPEQQQQQDEEERATKSPCQSQEPKSVPPTTSSSSSSQSNANANANTGTQTSSTPSRHTVHTSSQRHLFSPPPSSVKVSFSLISLISIATLCYTTALHCIVLNRSYFQKANGHSRLSCNDIYLRVARKIYLLIICLVIVCCVLYSTCMRSHLECIVINTLYEVRRISILA